MLEMVNEFLLIDHLRMYCILKPKHLIRDICIFDSIYFPNRMYNVLIIVKVIGIN